MSKKTPDKAAVAKVAHEQPAKREGRLAWAFGWIVLPSSIVGVLFLGGMLIGAHFHDSWFTRALVWIWDLLF